MQIVSGAWRDDQIDPRLGQKKPDKRSGIPELGAAIKSLGSNRFVIL